MKIKIPIYLKEKEVWAYRGILIILPAIFSALAEVWTFTFTWIVLISIPLLLYDLFKIIIETKTDNFK